MIEFLKDFYTLFFVWLTCLTALFLLQKSLAAPFRWCTLLIILVGVLETIASGIGFFYHIKNHFIFNVIYGIQLTLVPFFYRYWLKNIRIKRIIRTYVMFFPIFVLVNTIWIQGFYTLQTYTFVMGGSFVLLLAVAYLAELYADEEAQSIFRKPVFWFSLAFLLYFAVSIPYLGMLNYLWNHYPSFATLYYLLIFDGMVCLYNILLTTGLICLRISMK